MQQLHCNKDQSNDNLKQNIYQCLNSYCYEAWKLWLLEKISLAVHTVESHPCHGISDFQRINQFINNNLNIYLYHHILLIVEG